jgi:hypothetical protein
MVAILSGFFSSDGQDKGYRLGLPSLGVSDAGFRAG